MEPKRGAPEKLTQPVFDKIVELISAGGVSRRVAAQAVGVSPRTLLRWLTRGREPDSGIYCLFLSAIQRAEAEGEVASVQHIRIAGAKDWRAAAWFLERKYPKRWAKPPLKESRPIDDIGGLANLDFGLKAPTPDEVRARILAAADRIRREEGQTIDYHQRLPSPTEAREIVLTAAAKIQAAANGDNGG